MYSSLIHIKQNWNANTNPYIMGSTLPPSIFLPDTKKKQLVILDNPRKTHAHAIICTHKSIRIQLHMPAGRCGAATLGTRGLSPCWSNVLEGLFPPREKSGCWTNIIQSLSWVILLICHTPPEKVFCSILRDFNEMRLHIFLSTKFLIQFHSISLSHTHTCRSRLSHTCANVMIA